MIAIASGLEVNQSAATDQHAASVLVERFVPKMLRPTRVVIGSDEGAKRRSDEGEERKRTEPKAQSTEHKAQSTKQEEASQRPGSQLDGEIRATKGTEDTHSATSPLCHFATASTFVPTKGGDGGTPPLHLWLRRQMTAKALANLGRAIKRVNDDGQPEHEHGAALRTVSEAAGVRVNLKRVLVCVDEHDQAVVDTLKPTRDLYDRAHATTTIMEDRAVGVAPAARKGPRGCTVSNVQGAQPRLYPPSAMTSRGVAYDSAMDDTYERQQWLRENGLGETEAKHDAVGQRMEAVRVLGDGAFRAMVRGKTRG